MALVTKVIYSVSEKQNLAVADGIFLLIAGGIVLLLFFILWRMMFQTEQVKDISAEIKGFIGEREKKLTDILENERRFRHLTENATDIVYRLVLEDKQKLEYINPAFSHITGYEMQWAYDTPNVFDLLVSADDKAEWADISKYPFTESQAKLIRWIGKDGKLIWVEDRSQIVYSEEGIPVVREGIVRDVTRRVNAEKEVQQQISRMTAIRNVDQGIIAGVPLNRVYDLILHEILNLFSLRAAAVVLLDHVTERFNVSVTAGDWNWIEYKNTLNDETNIAYEVIRSQKTLHLKPEQIQNQKNVPLNTHVFFAPILIENRVMGVLQVFTRPHQPFTFSMLDFTETMAGQIAVAISGRKYLQDTIQLHQNLSEAYEETIRGWARAVNYRDQDTWQHTHRTLRRTLEIANMYNFSEEDLLHIRRGVILHDIGKLAVPDRILLKPGKLNDDEMTIMRQHPIIARDLMYPITYLRPAIDIPYGHHERWDGSGYPNGYIAEDIPLPARIFAVVDVWDALTSDRPYRTAWTIEDTRDYLSQNSGVLFDPEVVKNFFVILENLD